jgi:integrase
MSKPKPKPKPRSKRGSVKVESRSGLLYLRFTVDSARHTFSLNVPDSPANRYDAEKVAKQIELDILNRAFDPSYRKYRGQPEPESPEPSPQRRSLASIWPKWVEHKRQQNRAEQTLNTRYKTNGNHLALFGRDISTEADARKFMEYLDQTQGPQTLNRSLNDFQAFTSWGLSEGLIEADPFAALSPVRASKPSPREPFSIAEINRILNAFKTHPEYFCYHDFIATFLGLGLRLSEAIGVQWKRVKFEAGTIDICDQLGRGPNGESAGPKRVRRQTKTGSAGVRSLPPALLAILQGRYTQGCGPDDLIFAVDGEAIDDRKLRKGPWAKTLKLAGVPYRSPYNLRHTMASHAIAQGIPSTDVAKMLGHTSLRMVNEVYCHSVVNLPQAPDMGI